MDSFFIYSAQLRNKMSEEKIWELLEKFVEKFYHGEYTEFSLLSKEALNELTALHTMNPKDHRKYEALKKFVKILEKAREKCKARSSEIGA